MRLPDLLATKRGRLTAFFFLYLSEGIPQGFASTALAAQMRRQGVGVAEIALFVGTLYTPWAWKWAIGPFVDVLSSDRLGRRRMWIVLAQVLMVLTLMSALPVDFTRQMRLFTWVIILHNLFAATQDVAIDALATSTLREEERGLANGIMFGGAYMGIALGGSGVLMVSDYAGFKATWFLIAACLLSITLLVALPLREPRLPRPPGEGPPLRAAAREIRRFATDSARAFTGSRQALVGAIVALLPMGATAISLTIQTSIAVEIGMSDRQIGVLGFWSSAISAGFCLLGGWLSDRYGRRRMLALFLAGTAIPPLVMAWRMQTLGWVLPVSPLAADRPAVPQGLVPLLWSSALTFAVFRGLMYGTSTALFMDVTTPAVAATQFTAYMAMMNLAFRYSAHWQGEAIEAWGYPATLVLDAVVGVLSIALLPLMSPRRAPPAP